MKGSPSAITGTEKIENMFRSVSIGLANEMKALYNRM